MTKHIDTVYCKEPIFICYQDREHHDDFKIQNRSMIENLTIFSTIEDLKNCSDDILKSDIDSVRRDVVVAYILQLREKVKEAEQGLCAIISDSILNQVKNSVWRQLLLRL